MRLIDAIIKVKIFANGGFIDHKPINPEKIKIKINRDNYCNFFISIFLSTLIILVGFSQYL